ncbi:MAG TPA: LamG-like jellyroll fold domain-containing protein [Terriglobales bacterium]|nr:LamG-like jellyroll fold domain-containing protein [Terriglobales bacterium]
MRRLSGIVLVLCLSAASVWAQQLVGHWAFDEGAGSTVHDSSGKGNVGEIVGAKWAAGPSGKAGTALEFHDSSAEYPSSPKTTLVRIKHNDSLNPHKGFDLSATLFIDPAFAPTFSAVIAQKGEGYGCSYRLLLTEDFRLKAVAGNEHAVLESSTKLTPGKWVTARASYDGQALKIFIDGKEDASAAIQTTKLPSSDDIIIGKRFSGRIANVAIAIE